MHACNADDNHVHLLVTSRELDGASSVMKHLGQRYVQYVNHLQASRTLAQEGRFSLGPLCKWRSTCCAAIAT